MSFLSAAFLFGLPLVSIPVVIHLLNKRRREQILWGATQFLQEAATRQRRLFRLDDFLLMLLRALAVALFVLALARPQVKAGWLGSGGAKDVVLVLDTSLSTGARDSTGLVFDRLLEKAEAVVDDLKEGDVIRVLLASTPPEWLVPAPIHVNSETRSALKARLRGTCWNLGSADLLNCLRQAIDAEPAVGGLPRIVSVLTDGQAYGWRPEATAGWNGIREKIQDLPASGCINVLTLVEPGRNGSNLSLDSIETSRPLTGVGEPVVFTAWVRNMGAETSESCRSSWLSGEELLGTASLAAMDPGERTAVRFEHVFAVPGVHDVSCRLETTDDLGADNEAHHIQEVWDQIPILVVGPDVERVRFTPDTGFLLAALGSEEGDSGSRWHSVFRPRTIGSVDLVTQNLSDYACVVLTNVPPLPPEQLSLLERYVREGGGLWMSLGDETQRDHFNEFVFGQGLGLSPLPIGEPVGDASDASATVRIKIPDPGHPATRLLADPERLDLERVQIRQCLGLLKGLGDQEVSVLLSTTGGLSLAVEKSLGRGRSIILGVPLSVAWSDLPISQTFVVLVNEWLEYLSEPSVRRLNLRVGEALQIALPDSEYQKSGKVFDPRGKSEDLNAAIEGGRRMFEYSRTIRPGSYHLEVQTISGEKRRFPFQVARDPEESDLSPLPQSEREALADGAGLSFGENVLQNRGSARAAAKAEPLWTWLFVALLLLLMGELFTAVHLTRQRVAGAPPVAMDKNGAAPTAAFAKREV